MSRLVLSRWNCYVFMPFSIDICNCFLQSEEKKTCFNASVHRFRSRSLFSFFLPPHAHSELYDLLCPLFLFFCLKLWVINLVSQHLQELLGRRRKLWWTQFSPDAQHQILSRARLTSSLLTHPNLEEHNRDGYFSVKELYTQIPLMWMGEYIYFALHRNSVCTEVQSGCCFGSYLLSSLYTWILTSSPILEALAPPPLGTLSVDTQISEETRSDITILEISRNCTEKQIDT